MLLFDEYVQFFESNIALSVSRGTIGKATRGPVRDNALLDTPFGQTMGVEIDSTVPFIIDYYGYLKRSRGQNKMMKDLAPDKRHVFATVVHFSSLHLDTINRVAPAMMSKFADFKCTIIEARGFKKNAA